MVQVLVADETGLVKLINLKTKAVIAKCGTQTRENAVSAVTWMPSGYKSDGIQTTSCSHAAAVSKSGVVSVWDLPAQKVVHRCVGAGAHPIFIVCWRGTFVTINRAGELRVFPLSATDAGDAALVVAQLGANVSAARLHAPSGTLAVGGQENDLALWDLATGKQLWKAKNVPHTNLELRLPVWVKGIAFLPPSAGTASAEGGRSSGRAATPASPPTVLVVVTHYKQVRVYDTLAHRRPVRELTMGEHPFTCLSASHDGKHVFTGDAAGFTRRVDLTTMRDAGAYRGGSGAVKALTVHEDKDVPYLATVGLDRTLRVYNVDSRQLVRRVHLKQRLGAVAFAPPTTTQGPSRDAAEVADIEPEGPKANAGSGERMLAWRAYAVKERVRLQGLLESGGGGGGEGAGEGAGAGGQRVGKAGSGKGGKAGAMGEEEEEKVWQELDRRAAAGKRRRVGEGVAAGGAPPASRNEEEGEEDEDGEEGEDSDDYGLGDSEEGGGDEDEEEEEEAVPPPLKKRGGSTPARPPAKAVQGGAQKKAASAGTKRPR